MPRPLLCPQVLLSKDLTGRHIVITGANTGIGAVCAEQLARQGATVVLACRRVDAAKACATQIQSRNFSAQVSVRELDLADLDSVRRFAADYLADGKPLHALINNAGVMNTKQKKTKDGFDLQFGVNHLGHFLLTSLLLDHLKACAPSRIVSLSSCFHDQAMGRDGVIHFDDLHFEQRRYDGWEAYAQSKLANVLHARGLADRLEGTGVTAVSVHPGWVRTDLAKNSMPLFVQNILLRPFLSMMGMLEPWEGAQSTLFATLSDDLEAGAFYSQTGVYRDKSCNGGGWPLTSPNPAVHQPGMADRLWNVSAELVGLASGETAG